ncbi:hypothetical protein GE21DRAFT_1292548 [Neurospora crassa]|nr:hypothetical protein GE21DRAFT_1292548 [Neurospora crassa]
MMGMKDKRLEAGGWRSGLGLFFRVASRGRQTVLHTVAAAIPQASMFPQISVE